MNNRSQNIVMFVVIAGCSTYVLAKGASSVVEKPSMKGQIVAVDSIQLLHTSQEGQLVTKGLQAEIDSFTQSIDQAKLDLDKLESELKEQEAVLSKEALEAKQEEVRQKQEECDKTYAQREMKLRDSIQRQQTRLRDRHMAVMNKVMDKEGWAAIVDKNTPGVLCVAKNIDVTDMMLKQIDADYEGSLAPKQKSPESIVTAKAGNVEPGTKSKEIKAA